MTESLDDIKERYEALDLKLEAADPDVIDPACLLTFPYDYADNPAEVMIRDQRVYGGLPVDGTAGHRRPDDYSTYRTCNASSSSR